MIIRRSKPTDRPGPLLTLLAIAASPLLLAPDCTKSGAGGDPEACQQAADYQQECDLDAAAEATCGAAEQCLAQCVLETSCDGLRGTDSSAAQQLKTCREQCEQVDPVDCLACSAYLAGEATYDQICPRGQMLLNAWAGCICEASCEVECFEHCQGFDPNPMCSECIAANCATETQACQQD